MALSPENALTLYDSTNAANVIAFSPGAAGAASITINGLPVLTQTQANAAYLTFGPGQRALPAAPAREAGRGLRRRRHQSRQSYNSHWNYVSGGFLAASANVQAAGTASASYALGSI